MEALKGIPEVEAPLLTEQGEARLQKTDIFRRIMWFGFKEENTWYPLNIDRVNEILALNREGKKPATLQANEVEAKVPVTKLNSDLENLDKKYQGKAKKKKRNKNRSHDKKNPQQQNQNRNPKPRNPKGPNPR